MSDSEDLVPPTSSRQPRSLLPLDDGLPGVIDPDAMPMPESEERAPASRKVTSAPGSELDVEDFSNWEIDGVAAEPPSTRKAGWPGERKTPTEEAFVRMERNVADVDSIAPEVVRRTLPETELVVLMSANRAFHPMTFGELLDAALDLTPVPT